MSEHRHEFDEAVYDECQGPEHLRLCPSHWLCRCGAQLIPRARSSTGQPQIAEPAEAAAIIGDDG